MTERIVKPLPFLLAVKEVALFYVHVFKYIFGLVVLAALVQAIVSLVMPGNPTIGAVVALFGSIVSLFFYAWILYRADSVLMGRPETTKDALEVAKKRFLNLIGLLGLYILLAIVLLLFGFGMQMLGKVLHIEFLFAFITVCLVVFIFTLLAFTMPAIILDQIPVLKSFEYSTRLVWRHWWRTFGVILIYLIPVVLLSLGVLLLPTRNILIMTAYEFIYHIITYPIMISVILILYHDLKARHQIEGFKHVVEHK